MWLTSVLVQSLVNYVRSNPKAFFDTELIHVWTLGVAPYTNEKFQQNFRLDSFFAGDCTGNSVNSGRADYTLICKVKDFDEAAGFAKQLMEEVLEKERLTCSIGVAPSSWLPRSHQISRNRMD